MPSLSTQSLRRYAAAEQTSDVTVDPPPACHHRSIALAHHNLTNTWHAATLSVWKESRRGANQGCFFEPRCAKGGKQTIDVFLRRCAAGDVSLACPGSLLYVDPPPAPFCPGLHSELRLPPSINDFISTSISGSCRRMPVEIRSSFQLLKLPAGELRQVGAAKLRSSTCPPSALLSLAPSR